MRYNTVKIHFILILSLIFFNNLYGQSIRNNANRTILGTYIPNAPSIDGDLSDDVWVSSLDGVNFNSSTWRFGNVIDQKINIFDHGVNAPTASNLPPNDAFYNTHASFAMTWDTNYIYLAIRVEDPNRNFNVPVLSAAGVGNYSPGVELFFAMDDSIKSSKPSLAQVVPSLYNANTECHMILNYLGTDQPFLTTVNGGVIFNNNEGFKLSPDAYTISTSPISNGTMSGYNMEMAIKWRALNRYFLNGDITYNDITKKPVMGRIIGFDLANNIVADTGRVAQKMWSQCCYNTNNQHAADFGKIKLGTVNWFFPTYYIKPRVTPSNPIITVLGGTINLSTNISPLGVSCNCFWEISNSSDLNIATINNRGIVQALRNGVVTVSAYSLGYGYTVLGVVTITNQVMPVNISIHGKDSLQNMWESTTYRTSITGLGGVRAANNLVRWSIAENDPGGVSATIDPQNGELKSTSIRDANVTITATSLVDPTLQESKVVTIISPNHVTCSQILIETDQSMARCRTWNSLTLAGYNQSTKLNFSAKLRTNQNQLIPIPSNLIKYKLIHGQIVSSKLYTTIAGYYLSNVQPHGIFTVVGIYTKDTTIQNFTIIRLIGGLTESSTITGCPSSMFASNTTVFETQEIDNCFLKATTSTIEEKDQSGLNIFPSPANDFVHIESSNIYTDLEIMNSTGVVCLKTEFKPITDIRLFSPGFYLIILTNKKNNTRITHKLLIDR